jgi:hypothetical protein
MMFNDQLPIIVVAAVFGIAILWLYRDLQSLKTELKRGPPPPMMNPRRAKPEAQKVRFQEVSDEEDFDELPEPEKEA